MDEQKFSCSAVTTNIDHHLTQGYLIFRVDKGVSYKHFIQRLHIKIHVYFL